MEIKNVRGVYDFLPNEQKIRNFINDTLCDVFKSFGYNSIETPILCYFDMLSDKYDANNDLLKEIYRLKDNGNRDLGLRYDLTVPFAKFVALNKNKISFPFKRYEIAKVFRDGPIKAGRDREFMQCDVDVVGVSNNMIEAELLSLYDCAFKRLGIDIVIKYNSRKLMTGLILESGIDEDLVSIVTTIIDRKNKVSSCEFKEMLISSGVSKVSVDTLIKYFDLSLNNLNNTFKNSNNSLIISGLEELNSISSYISELKLDNCIFDITLARGQNYYTGLVFEVYDKLNRITSSIGGGGRYDNMITNFINDGNIYPAVGISFGLSSIYEILKNNDNNFVNDIIYIIPMGTFSYSLMVANKLRGLGYRVDIDLNFKKLKKSLDYANKSCIPFVIIIGEDEVNSGVFKLKDMVNNISYDVSLKEIDKIKSIL